MKRFNLKHNSHYKSQKKNNLFAYDENFYIAECPYMDMYMRELTQWILKIFVHVNLLLIHIRKVNETHILMYSYMNYKHDMFWMSFMRTFLWNAINHLEY